MSRIQPTEALNEQAELDSSQGHDTAGLLSRRALWAGAASSLAAGSSFAQGPLSPQLGVTRRRRDDLYYLVNRGSFGFTPELYAEAEQRGYDGWLDWQLNPESVPDVDVDLILAGYPTLTMSCAELFNGYGPNGTIGDLFEVTRALTNARIERAVKSKRQLFERVVDFWADHINVPHDDGVLRVFRTVYDREVIREHALGFFPDMLMASAKSAGMLSYLNGVENVVGAPNENYAREVMELHTLGVGGGYNENDILELARCFTGWSMSSYASPLFGEFRFRPMDHDFDSKSVMGQQIPAGGGVSDGEFMIDYLALHPTTAEYVSRELATFLLDYDPPQALVDEAKAVFLATGGHMKEVVRVVLDKKWIDVVDPWNTPKLRRPMHFACSVLRTPGLVISSFGGITTSLEVMGHYPFRWPAPDGYPDDLDTWGNAVLPRWDFAFRVFLGAMPGVLAPAGQLFGALGSPNAQELTASIAALLAGGNVDADELRTIDEFVQSGAATSDVDVMRNALALVASCPSYQYL